MRDYGFAAVKASRQAQTETSRRGNPLWLWVFNHLPKPRRPSGLSVRYCGRLSYAGHHSRAVGCI